MKDNQLAVRQSFQETQLVAKAMAESGFFEDSKSASQAIVKIMAGQEVGLGAFASMTGIHIIKGKPALGANLIASLIKNDPRYNYLVTKHTDQVCEIQFFENGAKCGVSSFSAEDARKAGTQNMQKFPRNMLFARAISNGAKWYCAGVFGGAPVYTPEELGAQVDDEGDIISGSFSEPEPVPASEVVIDAQQQPQQTEQKPARPFKPEVLKDMLNRKAQSFGEQKCEEKDRHMVAANLELIFAGNTATADRKSFTGWIFGETSVKNMACAEVLALKAWMNVTEVKGEWIADANAISEAHSALTIARKAEGQQELGI